MGKLAKVSLDSKILILLIPLFYLLNFLTNWELLNVSHLRGGIPFGDLQQQLQAAACWKHIGVGVYVNSKSNAECFFQYGHPLLQFFNFFHVKSTHTLWVGRLLAGCVVSALTLQAFRFSKSTPPKTTPWLILLACSPGVWLLLERGNVDEIIFLLVLAGIYLLSRGQSIFAFLVFFITAVFKFYTLPLLILPLIMSKQIWKKALFLFGILLSILTCWMDLKRVVGIPTTWFISSGSEWIGLWWNLAIKHLNVTHPYLSIKSAKFVGYMFFAALLFFVSKVKFHPEESQLQNEDKSLDLANINFVAMFTVFLSCYLTGMSYDYRLIFLVSALLSLNRPKAIKQPIAFVCISLAALYGTCFLLIPPTGLLSLAIQFVGNLNQAILAAVLLPIFLRKSRTLIYSNLQK